MQFLIGEAVLHVLDSAIDLPVLSDRVLAMNAEIESFLTAHLEKIWESDNLKSCVFSPDSIFASAVAEHSSDFLGFSQKIATAIFTFMRQNVSIPSGDLTVLTVQADGESYMVLMKMNYKESYIHHFEYEGDQKSNTIIKQKTGLPTASSTVEEALIVNMANNAVKVIEKKYEIDGKRDFYLSRGLLGCDAGLSEKQKFDTIRKATESINERYQNDERTKPARVMNTICARMEEDNEARITELGDVLYGDLPAAKEEFEQILQEKNIDPADTVKVSQKAVRRLEKQSLKTSSGVEIKIPIALYETGDSVEFITNPDGTISLLIKNVIM